MKLYLSIILTVVLSCSVFGQKTVSELNPKHAIVLRDFLEANQPYSFLSEVLYDAEFLKEMRDKYGKRFMPYYKVGDFNHDGSLDFALFLKKEGKPTQEGNTEPFSYSYPMALVVFNGSKKGTFRKAFLKDEMNPYVMYLDWTIEKKRRLFYGMDGGLGGTMLTPIGKGYIAETVYH